jgi:condensation domain-containing protein
VVTSNNLSTLSESKRRLVERWLRGQAAPAREDSHNLIAITRGETLPLSLAEEQIWRRDQASLGLPPFYNESITVHRKGPLDPEVLQQSLWWIIQLHEIWRTTYKSVNGRPLRVIHTSPSLVPMRKADLRTLPPNRRESEALRIAAEGLKCRFDLEAGPLVRFTLVRLEDDYWRLYVAAHQIVLDGVTAYQIFFPELIGVYEALASGKSPSLPAAAVQYADYAFWQRKWIDRNVTTEQLQYWRKQFPNAVDKLAWPRRNTIQLSHSFRGKIHPFVLDPAVGHAVKELSAKHNTTLFATLLAACVALLHRYTRQNEIVIGTVTPAGRDCSEVQRVMGYFLNPVGMRSEVSAQSRFSELMQSTQETLLGALRNDDVPYEEVVEALGPKALSGLNPIFQIAASLEPTVPDVSDGWDLTPMDVESGGTRWPLYFVWENRPVGITGRVQYNPDLFTVAVVKKFVEDFQALLEVVARDPQVRMAELPMFTSGE